jgi:hypothetical protein
LSRAAPIAGAIAGIGIGQARATPRATPIARPIAGIGIGQPCAAPCTAAIARPITRVGIRQAAAAWTATATSWPVDRIRIRNNGHDWGLLPRLSSGAARCTQKGRGRRQMQDQEPPSQRVPPRFRSGLVFLVVRHRLAPHLRHRILAGELNPLIVARKSE